MDFRVLISPYSKFFNPRGWRAITCLEDVSPWRQNLVSSAPGDIYFPQTMQHNFVLTSYVHSLEKDQLSIELKSYSPYVNLPR